MGTLWPVRHRFRRSLRPLSYGRGPLPAPAGCRASSAEPASVADGASIAARSVSRRVVCGDRIGSPAARTLLPGLSGRDWRFRVQYVHLGDVFVEIEQERRPEVGSAPRSRNVAQKVGHAPLHALRGLARTRTGQWRVIPWLSTHDEISPPSARCTEVMARSTCSRSTSFSFDLFSFDLFSSELSSSPPR